MTLSDERSEESKGPGALSLDGLYSDFHRPCILHAPNQSECFIRNISPKRFKDRLQTFGSAFIKRIDNPPSVRNIFDEIPNIELRAVSEKFFQVQHNAVGVHAALRGDL